MTVLVVRDTGGDLLDGARERVERIPFVRSVETLDVHGVRPSLNDLRVEVTARLRLYEPPDDERSLETRLTDSFGVREAVVRRLE